MALSADLRKALVTGALITAGSVAASVIPVHIWLQFDPVIDLASIYFVTAALPAIIAPSCSFLILRARMKADRLARENHRLAFSDELTGLPNRRAFFAAASELRARAAKTGAVFACAIADIDNFKQVNDEFGHEAGDSVLQSVAKVLQRMAPKDGVAARLGGEEFAVAGVFANEDEARAAFSALVRGVGQQDCVHEDVRLCVTVSLGFSLGETGEKMSAVLSRADHALYRAKQSGKNRALSFTDNPRRPGQQAMIV